MIAMLYEEAKKISGNEIPAQVVHDQLPYFCCPNVILDSDIQKDISRYLYCIDTGTLPYPGPYGDIPKKWISIHYVIKSAMISYENTEKKKYLDKQKRKTNG